MVVAMPEALIKGTCLRSVIGFLRDAGMLDDVVRDLGPESRVVFGSDLLPVNWYPVEAYLELLDRVADVGKPHAEAYFDQIGRRIIRDGLSGVYRAFLPVETMLRGLRRGSQLWGFYFRGSELQVIELDEHNARLPVLGEPRTTHAYCRTKLAGISEALAMAGAANVQVSHNRCVLRGNSVCEYELCWTD